VFGVGLAALSLTALFGAVNVNESDAKDIEDKMYQAKVAAQEINSGEEPGKEDDSSAASENSASAGNEN
jgi:hypothetical protein